VFHGARYRRSVRALLGLGAFGLVEVTYLLLPGHVAPRAL
jgi:hypothetical protein